MRVYDETLAVATKYAKTDSRIKVVSNEVNLKLPMTLNRGFDEANGDYYTWTSDDNMYKPNAFQKLVDELEANPDCVMVYSDYTNIDADDNVIDEGTLMEPEHICEGNVCGACFLYTAEVAKKVGKYDANLFLAEDYDYWIRIYHEGKMRHIKESLYLYRRHAQSLTETKKASVNMQTYRALEKNFLTLYSEAKKDKMSYAFFSQLIKRVSPEYVVATTDMLITVDSGFGRYMKLQERINNTHSPVGKKIYKVMKGFIAR
ncbi:MAG: glycosyltransferase [Bacteroidaceae bacterium]|nr:glycosyltransferase [Bacteroidaceae bacterium]